MGYLAFVISEEKYNVIPSSSLLSRPEDLGTLQLLTVTKTITLQTSIAPTSRPTYSKLRAPTILDLVSTDTQSAVISSAEVTIQKADCDETVKWYYVCQAVKQALSTQNFDTVDPKYLDTLRNIDINMINE